MQLRKIVERVEPVVSADVKTAAVTGTVVVDAAIGPDGAVTDSIALSGPKELQSAAAAAVKKWRFQPTLQNGKPVHVYSTFRVRVGSPQQ